jgi:hypothetical protein
MHYPMCYIRTVKGIWEEMREIKEKKTAGE